MKKFLFAVAALATCMSASAQLWVGGSLKFDNSKTWQNDNSTTSWNISPKIGYALDDALEVGLGFGIGGSSFKTNAETKRTSFDFSIAPFARYTFFTDGDFSMFVEGNVEYAYHKSKSEPKSGSSVEGKNWSFGINIMPGIKYALTDQFALVATLGALSFNHYQPDKEVTPWGGTQNQFGLNLDSVFSFGLYYSF